MAVRIFDTETKLIRGNPLRVPQKAGNFLTTRKRLVFRDGLCSLKSAGYEGNEQEEEVSHGGEAKGQGGW